MGWMVVMVVDGMDGCDGDFDIDRRGEGRGEGGGEGIGLS